MEAYKLHPLALVNISDHYVRFKAQLAPEEEPPRVLGCLLGMQEGNLDLEICNSFELTWTPEEGTNKVVVDAEYLEQQKVRYKTVYPKLDVVGWYSTGQAVDHDGHDLAIHKSICDVSEAPVYLIFDPFRIAMDGAGDEDGISAGRRTKIRGAKLPIDLVEAVVCIGEDGSPTASYVPTGQVRHRDDGDRAHRDGQRGQGGGLRGFTDWAVRVALPHVRQRDGAAQRAGGGHLGLPKGGGRGRSGSGQSDHESRGCAGQVAAQGRGRRAASRGHATGVQRLPSHRVFGDDDEGDGGDGHDAGQVRRRGARREPRGRRRRSHGGRRREELAAVLKPGPLMGGQGT